MKALQRVWLGLMILALSPAALAFSIDRVKGQRRFARAAWPGDHHQLVTRDLERKILEIMLPRTGNFDQPLGHRKGAS